MKILFVLTLACSAACAAGQAQSKPTVAAIDADPNWALGRHAVESFTGCYLIDYSYVETEALQPGYPLDHRVYDVNTDKSVKEWIYAEDLGRDRLWLQHILFAAGPDNKVRSETLLKHQAEDWRYNAPSLYAFTGPGHWSVRELHDVPNSWTRKITNLDDGPRYQCAAPWTHALGYPEWRCTTYAPIPGRETRDMARKDYNTMQRITRLVAYQNSWLERQYNTKTQHQANGEQRPLVKEQGKTWSVRLPDSECAEAQAYVAPRLAFWHLLRDVWDAVLDGRHDFGEQTPPGKPPRFAALGDIEEAYMQKDLSQANIRAEAEKAIRDVIAAYGVPEANAPQPAGR